MSSRFTLATDADSVQNEKGGSGSLTTVGVLLGLVLIVGPLILPSLLHINIPLISILIMECFGFVLVLASVVILTVTNLYKRAPADKALVRTGMGGPQVIIDGGTFFVPFAHQLIMVSLRTRRFEVSREGRDALLTLDSLRCDITAEFFVKIPKDAGRIKSAATSLGAAANNDAALFQILEKKLESALRQVAAEMDLMQLMRNRAELIRRVTEHVQSDLAHNGFELETITISRLDQTPITALSPEHNIFDAQGARASAAIVQEQLVQRTKIELGAKREIEQETVITTQYLAQQALMKAKAEAERDRNVKIAQATANQEAESAQAEQNRLAQSAVIESERSVELANIERQQQIGVAAKTREQVEQEAEAKRQQGVEVANRNALVAIALAEEAKALAIAKQLLAEASRAKNEQEVQTVTVTATANRQKEQQIIAAQASQEQKRLAEQIVIDLSAYQITKSAEARRQAAIAEAEALLTQARASQQAKELEAQGKQAIEVVPVTVDKQRVEVESARVAVSRQDLANKAEFETIARELQVQLAQIEAEKQVRIEQARSMSTALAGAHLQLWGDPEALTRMKDAFYSGQHNGQMIQGVLSNMPPEAFSVAVAAIPALAQILKKRFGVQIDSETLHDAVVQLSKEKSN